MNEREEILGILKGLKPELISRYRVKEIALFGSFVRQEQGGGSDIDLLVDFEEEASLFDLVRLALFLEEKFHRKVDVIPKDSIRAEIREAVLQEMVPL